MENRREFEESRAMESYNVFLVLGIGIGISGYYVLM